MLTPMKFFMLKTELKKRSVREHTEKINFAFEVLFTFIFDWCE